MKTVRIVLWGLVVVAAGVAGYLWLERTLGEPAGQTEAVKIGGPFELVRNDGTAITEKSLEGRRHAMFFGFTHCPDICPTTLMEAAGWLRELGEDAGKLDFYFVTVDPGRDTAEIMNDYVNAFDPRITGLTGSPENIEQFLKDYRVYANRVDLGEGDYTMDHSAFVMLFDEKGDFKGTISFDENPQTAMAKLRRLIGNG